MGQKRNFPRYVRSDNERFPEEKVASHERVILIKELIGYEFKNPALLEQALTHHSFCENETGDSNYERLEYVGDAVLSLLIAKYHYFMYPDLKPGKLTNLRAANVDTEKLARVAFKYELYKFLRHNHPTLEGQIGEFKNEMPDYPVHSGGLIDAPKVLADIVESLIGAIFLDSKSSIDTTWTIVKTMLEPIITLENLMPHAVTMLVEFCSRNRLNLNKNDLWEEKGIIELYMDNKLVGSGDYRGKRNIANNRAAHNAYHHLLSTGYGLDSLNADATQIMGKKKNFPHYVRNDDERFAESKISSHERVKLINGTINYEFNDQTLLEEALTHHSFFEDKTNAYERLEYVGDAVLGLLIAKFHYFMYPNLNPGELTKLRAANVDTEKLARVAFKYELYKFLRHNHPTLNGQINEFSNALAVYPVHSWGLIDPPKVLADIVESLVGAIYLDSNSSMDTTWMVVKNLLEPAITPKNLKSHPVTMLNQICQKNGLKWETKDFCEVTGDIELYVDGKLVGSGNFPGKKYIASNRAAYDAYKQLVCPNFQSKHFNRILNATTAEL